MQDKLIALRIPKDLYQHYVEKAIEESNKKNKIITLSKIIREILEKNK